jgi:hypothetical protein
MRQWHPLFAYFLRLILEGSYEVLTNLAVGDVPREADVVVVKRAALRGPQFRRLWKWLTTWNILEFKGPTVRSRASHLDLLLELGLGVARRLNEERAKDKLRPLPSQQISWWYVSRKLSRSLLAKWVQRVGRLTEVEAGLWHGAVCGYPLYLVSSIETPLDEESLPLHLLAAKKAQEETALAQYVLGHPDVYRQYAPWMFALHTRVWEKEKTVRGNVISVVDDHLEIDWKPVVEEFGLDLLIRQVGLDKFIEEAGLAKVIEEAGLAKVIEEVGLAKVIEEVGLAKVIEEVGLAKVIEEVGLAKVIEEVGLAKVIEEVGLAKVIEEVGLARVIDEVGVDKLLDSLSPQQLAKLRSRL